MIGIVDNFISAQQSLVIHVARKRTGVLIDSYNIRTIDLEDIEKFPEEPPPGKPSATTRCELLCHTLREYKRAMHDGFVAGQGRQGYATAHNDGIAAQTSQREANGQPGAAMPPTQVGPRTASFPYDNGASTHFTFDGDNKVTGVTHNESVVPHTCDGVEREVETDIKDGSASNTDRNAAISKAKNAAKARARKEAEARCANHACPNCNKTCRVEVDDPVGEPVVDPYELDSVTTRYEATIGARWHLFVKCSP
jgi:hypothetical protein